MHTIESEIKYLTSMIGIMEKTYIKLGRSTNKRKINRLQKDIQKIATSNNLPLEKKLHLIVNELENAFNTAWRDYSRFRIGTKFTNFINQLKNTKHTHFHYPRMLALILKTHYTKRVELRLPQSFLWFEVKDVNAPGKYPAEFSYIATTNNVPSQNSNFNNSSTSQESVGIDLRSPLSFEPATNNLSEPVKLENASKYPWFIRAIHNIINKNNYGILSVETIKKLVGNFYPLLNVFPRKKNGLNTGAILRMLDQFEKRLKLLPKNAELEDVKLPQILIASIIVACKLEDEYINLNKDFVDSFGKFWQLEQLNKFELTHCAALRFEVDFFQTSGSIRKKRLAEIMAYLDPEDATRVKTKLIDIQLHSYIFNNKIKLQDKSLKLQLNPIHFFSRLLKLTKNLAPLLEIADQRNAVTLSKNIDNLTQFTNKIILALTNEDHDFLLLKAKKIRKANAILNQSKMEIGRLIVLIFNEIEALMENLNNLAYSQFKQAFFQQHDNTLQIKKQLAHSLETLVEFVIKENLVLPNIDKCNAKEVDNRITVKV